MSRSRRKAYLTATRWRSAQREVIVRVEPSVVSRATVPADDNLVTRSLRMHIRNCRRAHRRGAIACVGGRPPTETIT